MTDRYNPNTGPIELGLPIGLDEMDPRSGLIGIKAEVDGKTVILHPDDVELIYEDTLLATER